RRPSTSYRYGPSPRTMNLGVPPTARNARTGELTPPGTTARARSYRAVEAGASAGYGLVPLVRGPTSAHSVSVVVRPAQRPRPGRRFPLGHTFPARSRYPCHVERPELTISVLRTPGEAVVSLSGEIDMLAAIRLSNTVNDILTDPPPRIVLVLGGVTSCDSQGLGTLVVLSRKASTAQSVLVLTNVGDFLLRVLDITGLRSALMIRNETAQH